MGKPIVAIVGRPNTGKSSLFNAIAREPISIVKDTPGVARDRIYADYTWLNRNFTLIGTGGIEPESQDKLLVSIWEQMRIAIGTADVIIFLIDVRTGITGADSRVADMLCRVKKPVVLVINKVDSFTKFQSDIYEFYGLACGDPVPVSATSRLGIGDLLEAIEAYFPQVEESEAEEDEHLKVTLIGKPNVDKSSIINRLLGENRVTVSDIVGTMHDTIDTVVIHDGREYVFIDTAGIRRKSKIHENIERYSIIHMMTVVEWASVVLLMIDASESITEQDAEIAGIAYEEGKGILVVVNKWDLIEKTDKTMKRFTDKVRNALSFMSYAEFLSVSAETSQRMNKPFEMIDMIHSSRTLRIRAGVLNGVITETTISKQPPPNKGHRLKIFYTSRVAVKPPTFVFFADSKELMHFSYQRYLKDRIHEVFSFHGTVLRFFIRERQGKDKE